jgi:hypothetical protein
LDALAASGLSVSAFAEQEGLDEERLYRWQRRFARERKAEPRTVTPSATPAIVELRAATSPSPRAPPLPSCDDVYCTSIMCGAERQQCACLWGQGNRSCAGPVRTRSMPTPAAPRWARSLKPR